MNTEKILIVGTGTMGEGIAQTFAQNGFSVRLVARREEPLTRALGQIRQNVKQFIEFDLIQETVDQVMGRIEGMVTTDMAQAVEGCSYVVETIRENAGRQAGAPGCPPGGRTRTWSSAATPAA